MKLPQSYLSVFYDLRPAKQVERRMIIDGLHRLARVGFDIAEYQYTGMGSIYFIDFILFHKLLGIHRLLSVEADQAILRRIRFNKPFREVETQMGPIGDTIPSLSLDRRHLLWLDYDSVIASSQLQDVVNAAVRLPTESVLLVTVDVEPPGGDGPADWREHFLSEAGDYLGMDISVESFAESALPKRTCDLLLAAINRGLAGRDANFLPLFHFLYADGHKMLTIGGMIGDDNHWRKIRASTIGDTAYFRRTFRTRPYEIYVPRLTRKERLHLDCHMPCSKKWKPQQFELRKSDIKAYSEIYRFFPAYAELLL